MIYTQKRWKSYKKQGTGAWRAIGSRDSRGMGPIPRAPWSRLLDLEFDNVEVRTQIIIQTKAPAMLRNHIKSVWYASRKWCKRCIYMNRKIHSMNNITRSSKGVHILSYWFRTEWCEYSRILGVYHVYPVSGFEVPISTQTWMVCY